jgi:predicted SnoaL-like aldol condensation-catalyzing enzyme
LLGQVCRPSGAFSDLACVPTTSVVGYDMSSLRDSFGGGQLEWYYPAMSSPQREKAAERPTRQEDLNKSLIELAFQEVFASDAFDETAIARYFSPRYVQKTDGHTLDFPGFVTHVRELKRTLKSVKITFERLVAEGANVVSIHRAEAEKIAGGRIAVRVFALFVIDDGKIVLCDELTYLERGAAEDRDLSSRR